MMPGMPKRRTQDYLRHGMTGLFAAFDIPDGTVISELHRRHCGADPQVPGEDRQDSSRRPGSSPGLRELHHHSASRKEGRS
jgi:hypothetical protein